MPAHPSPHVHDTGLTRWQNWHENFDQPLRGYYDVWNLDPTRSSVAGYNATTRALQGLIGEAIQKGLRIRALGGGWSFTPVAATNGLLLNTRPLNYRFRFGPGQLHPSTDPGRRMVFVQAGMSIADLNLYLSSRGWALKTSGASNGQTIAGALSTGTHGSAFNVGAVPDYVHAMHVVTGPNPGDSIWIERASARAAHDGMAGLLNASLVADDDDVFDSALVSFGSFGIIHGVLIEVDPLYWLQTWRKRVAYDDTLWTAIENRTFAPADLPGADGREPYHFQLLFNPHEGDAEGMIIAMYREDVKPDVCKPPKGGGIAPGDSALEVVGGFTDIFSGITGDLSKLLFEIGVPEIENECGPPGVQFRDTSTRGRAASSAMGVPLNRAREATLIASEKVREANAPALIAVRIVKAGRGKLQFTRHDPATAVVEIDGPDSNSVRRAFRTTWQALEARGIHNTFHWGKINNLDATNLRTKYGDAAVEDWLTARRQVLGTPLLRDTFANSVTDALDLSD